MNMKERSGLRVGARGMLAVVLVATAFSAAAAPVQVTLSVRSKRAEDARNTSARVGDIEYEMQTTTYTEKGTSSMSLEMNIRNMGKEPQTLQLDWYFFGNPVDTKLPDFLADKGSESVTVPGGSGKSVSATSKALKFNKQTGHNVKVREGAEVSGYLVTLKAAGTVVASDASTPSLKKLVTDKKKMKELLDAAAEAEAALPPPAKRK